MKRLLTFRLRTIFAAITLIGIFLVIRTSRLNVEDHAINNIRAAGAHISFGRPYHPQYGDSYSVQSRSLSYASRLLLGNQDQDVCSVRFPWDNRITDCDIDTILPSLADLGNLRELNFQGTGITNSSIDAVSSVLTLEVLNLCVTDLDDGSVDALKRLPKLRYLDIFGTKISEAAAADLQSSHPRCLIRGPKKSVGFFGHDHYADANSGKNQRSYQSDDQVH